MASTVRDFKWEMGPSITMRMRNPHYPTSAAGWGKQELYANAANDFLTEITSLSNEWDAKLARGCAICKKCQYHVLRETVSNKYDFECTECGTNSWLWHAVWRDDIRWDEQEDRPILFPPPTLLSLFSLKLEVEDWAMEYFHYVPEIDISWYRGFHLPDACRIKERRLGICFRSVSDAVAFRLRWM